MNASLLDAFISGAIAMGFAAIALFFQSFWKRSRILLFGFFSAAFALLALERVIMLLVAAEDRLRPFVYLVRLAAFLLIIAGIVAQNRRPAAGHDSNQ